jgi:hypothetical protein
MQGERPWLALSGSTPVPCDARLTIGTRIGVLRKSEILPVSHRRQGAGSRGLSQRSWTFCGKFQDFGP